MIEFDTCQHTEVSGTIVLDTLQILQQLSDISFLPNLEDLLLFTFISKNVQNQFDGRGQFPIK